MSAPQRRFTSREIGLLRYLAVASGFVKLRPEARELLVPLWRRGMIHCISLTTPGVGTHGPYFQLTAFGRQLAAMFVQADRTRRAIGSPAFARDSAPTVLQPPPTRSAS